MFIGGKPGTGKTASVMDVVRDMERKAEQGVVPRFQFVEVNGLRLPTPKHAYVRLHEVRSRPAAGKGPVLPTCGVPGLGLLCTLPGCICFSQGEWKRGTLRCQDTPRALLLYPLLFI